MSPGRPAYRWQHARSHEQQCLFLALPSRVRGFYRSRKLSPLALRCLLNQKMEKKLRKQEEEGNAAGSPFP